jgi:hypothetical protein
LEDHGDVALAGVDVGYDSATESDFAARDLLETGSATEERRLPASRRAHEDHEFAVRDVKIHPGERKCPVVKALKDVLEAEGRHQTPPRARDCRNLIPTTAAFVIIIP